MEKFENPTGQHFSSPEYKAYQNARTRCTNRKSPSYPNYGGRGIEFKFASLEEWLAEVGRRPTSKHSINRIDNDGHYEKGNVEWATSREQALNRRPKAQSKTETGYKIPLAAKVAPIVRQAVENVAADDDRSVSNVIERALKNSPMIAEEIERIQERQAA